MEQTIKVYVPVLAKFNERGNIVPLRLMWEDGQKYTIDKILDICPAAALRAGGQGDRYTIQVNGRRSYLFFERSTDLKGTNLGRWFVERRAAQ